MRLVSKQVKRLNGTARVPGDKSISHRALMLGALARGETTVTGLLESEDVFRTAKALIAMGAHIMPPGRGSSVWHIEGAGRRTDALRAPRSTLDLGNSGTSARLLMGIAAGYPFSAKFTGDASLVRRPMGRVIKPLSQMGAQFEATGGDKFPLRLTGSAALRPITYTLPVASAQVKSAIMLAALAAEGTTTIIEPVPTRDHSERMLRYFGAKVTSEPQKDGSNIVTVAGGGQLSGRPVVVPADPSSAAFIAAAALVTPESDVTITDVMTNPLRTGFYETLKDMGADITFKNQRDKSGESMADIQVRSSRLKGVTVPPERVSSMIDEFPILFALAACAEGDSVMTGLEELRVKESDRLTAMAKGLAAAGVKLETGDASMKIFATGAPPQGGCTVDAGHDHRIAMSFLVLGMASQEPIAVTGAETIATSFPTFVTLMNTLGAGIEEIAE